MNKQSDSLARDVMLAKQAGMSYGKWKAQQPFVPIADRKIPDGWKRCETCGKPFKPASGGKRYCEAYCRTKAYRERALELQREYYRKSKKKKGENETNENSGHGQRSLPG